MQLDLAWISLGALLLVILASCTTKVNPGFLAIALAWLIGVYVAPQFDTAIGLKGVWKAFPSDLFLTLVGATLLFTQAFVNGTLERVAKHAVRICRGNVGLMPVMFFTLTMLLSAMGAGNIASAALMAPMAMAVAHKAAVPAFLMIIMVAHGSLAGALSPFSPTGIIANGLLEEKMGLVDYEFRTFGYNLAAHLVVALGGYLLFGGWRLFSHTYSENAEQNGGEAASPQVEFQWPHGVTLAIILTLVVAVVGFNVHVGMGAFLGAVVLSLLRLTDDKKTLLTMPWGVILMVCGVTVLTAMLEQTGGLDRFAQIVSTISTPNSVTGVIALLTGLVSVYSSTSGVVLPAVLPMVPKLVSQLGGGDPAAIAQSVIVGGHMVDSSPLSTIGALCIASASAGEDRGKLFNQLLAWGLSMAIIGALVCYVFFGLLWSRS